MKTPPRQALRTGIIVVAAFVFAAATVRRFHWLGGPYFEFPQTVQDHVNPQRFPSRDAILLCQRLAPLLPRGATATVIFPPAAPNFDQTHWLTGLGLLTHQRVVPPLFDGENAPQYVLTIRTPWEHASYALEGQYPEGYLYVRTP
jgi:hypothetical protein